MLRDVEHENVPVVKKTSTEDKNVKNVSVTLEDGSRDIYDSMQENLIDVLNGKGQILSVPVTEEEEAVEMTDEISSTLPEYGSSQDPDPPPEVAGAGIPETEEEDYFNYQDLLSYFILNPELSKLVEKYRIVSGIILGIVYMFFHLDVSFTVWGLILLSFIFHVEIFDVVNYLY
jgi:hypothetical protein